MSRTYEAIVVKSGIFRSGEHERKEKGKSSLKAISLEALLFFGLLSFVGSGSFWSGKSR
jgi:hypothetical protein